MNVELLRKVQAAILANPETFDMDDWHCDTVMCVAGHAAILNGHQFADDSSRCDVITTNELVEDVAQDDLDLDDDQADRLFFTDSWPDNYARRYGFAETDRARAQVASDYIDYFIQTNGGAE